MHTVHIVCKSTYFLTTRQTFRLKITRISKIYPPKQKNPRKICTYQKFSVTLHPLLKHEASANNQKIHRGVEQLVARQAHNLEVTRSSRVSATTFKPNRRGQAFFFSTPLPTTLSHRATRVMLMQKRHVQAINGGCVEHQYPRVSGQKLKAFPGELKVFTTIVCISQKIFIPLY